MLVRVRMKQAVKRHAQHFYWEMSDNQRRRNPVGQSQIRSRGIIPVENLRVDDCLPGRRDWPRPSRRMRNGMSVEKAQELALTAYVMGLLGDGSCSSPWKGNLQRLIETVLKRVESGEIVFHRPCLHLLEKGRDSFRCLSTFECLPDRVIIGRLAMYLREVFDPLMRANSYSFRSDGSIGHHTALRNLRRYRLEHPGKLFVAECDIQKFFDVLGHGVAMDAFEFFASTCGRDIEPWMRNAFMAYLDSYSSYRNLSEDVGIAEEQKRKVAFWSDENLRARLMKLHGVDRPESLEVGIPQGGALSPLIINMVMHRADDAVLSSPDEELFYARYCDDMVIVHCDQKRCKEAFGRYLAMMESLLLPVHPLVRGLRYGRSFYDGKSKGPYAWTDCRPGTLRSSPWVSFLGEQIRFDGSVRIRKESVDKQIQKLRKERGLLLRAIGRTSSRPFLKPGFDKRMVFERFRARLAAIGVGYAPRELMGSRDDRCWMAAFPGITPSRWTRVQTKRLDRVRDDILHSLFKDDDLRHGIPGAVMPYLGRPYSYRGFLERLERSDRVVFAQGLSVYGEW